MALRFCDLLVTAPALVATLVSGCGTSSDGPGPREAGAPVAEAGVAAEGATACAAPADYVVLGDAEVIEDATRIVVLVQTSPQGTSYRIFFGPREHVAERTLIGEGIGSTEALFTFDVDGVSNTAIFPSGADVMPGTSRLLVGDPQSAPVSKPFELLSPPGTYRRPAADLTFFCK